MLLSKRFSVAVGVTGSASAFMFYQQGWDTGSALDDAILSDIYKDTALLTKVSIDSSIDSNISGVKASFAYTLFSTNLDSFVKKLHEHFHTWALFRWADSFLQEGNNESYLVPKATIYDELVKLKFSYAKPSKANLTPQNWDRDSYIATQAKPVLEKQFKDVFFSTLFVTKKGDKHELGFDESIYTQYGRGSYSSKVSHFQQFIYDEWIKQESPFLLCTRDWKYSTNFNQGNFKNEDSIKKPEKPSFDFPDFGDIESEVKEFNNSYGNSNGKKDFCRNQDYQIWTASKIAELKDGYKASAILWRNGKDNGNSATKTINGNGEKVLDLFVDNGNGNQEQTSWNVPKDLLSSSSSDKKNLFALRDVKSNNNNNIATYARTLSGLSFFFKNSEHSDTKKFLLKNLSESESERTKKIGLFELKDELKEFFGKKAGQLLASYLSKNKSQLFKDGISEKLSSLLGSTYEFAQQLDKNQNLWKILHSFSETSKNYLDVKWGQGQEEKAPSKEHGLATPILFKRNLDMITSLGEAKWLTEIKSDNDGSFTTLTKDLFKEENKEELFNKAQELKKELAKFFSNVSVNEEKQYFNDYLLDNIYYDFKKADIIKKTIRNVALINKLGFNWFKNEINDYSIKVARSTSLPNNTQEELQQEIKNSVIDVFYAKEYLKEDYSDRLNYGGYKYTNINNNDKYCARKITNGDTKKLTVSTTLNDCSKKTEHEENEKQFRQKLVNYWLIKNYYYHAYGYEISSDLSSKYIYYLYSIFWLTNNQFANLKSFILSNIPSNRFGALVWMDKVEKAHWKNGEIEGSEAKIGKNKTSDNNQAEIDNVDMYFRDVNLSDIFNPFASTKIDKPKETNEKFPLNSDRISAFAKTGNNEFTEFFGFQGFVSEVFGDLDKEIMQKIFKNFQIHNPSKNKNYNLLTPYEVKEENTTGLAFGTVVKEQQDVNTVIDSFGGVDTLLHWVNSYFKSQSDILKSWVSEKNANAPLANKANIPLPEMKQKVKEIFKDGQAYKNATTRFSGFLQGSTESTFQDQKFFIANKDNTNTGWIIYITQVNRNDFQGGFEKLIDEIGIKTLFKMLAMLPNVEVARMRPAHQMFLENNLTV
ncbi:hypothetical protein A6V39_04630 [Candidatus Mycoplasma haematobovis]|uniref:Uncharacterized protein n=1 Tax=Candidatus Mycoplasma haematobovis TaxID=432608 RepID=A0A1A9QER1_9MOLU|nr:DUF3713 domain-containing protein [Candidatus Mycoplasma haematobovis]OAL10170.1 hypothetical protein A6V39_04630 [Candidatus Mycoplasma haematobovis]